MRLALCFKIGRSPPPLSEIYLEYHVPHTTRADIVQAAFVSLVSSLWRRMPWIQNKYSLSSNASNASWKLALHSKNCSLLWIFSFFADALLMLLSFDCKSVFEFRISYNIQQSVLWLSRLLWGVIFMQIVAQAKSIIDYNFVKKSRITVQGKGHSGNYSFWRVLLITSARPFWRGGGTRRNSQELQIPKITVIKLMYLRTISLML